jgi:electron transfer flavoprotein alpha subunit
MAGIYIYSDKIDTAAELVGFAKRVGKSAIILAVSEEAAVKASESGADKVVLLEGGDCRIENYGKAIAKFLQEEDAELFAAASTVRGREIAANVAGYLGCAMVSDIRSAEFRDGRLETVRMIYGGAVLQNETITGLCVITVQPALFEPAEAAQAEIVRLSVEVAPRIRLISTAPVVKEGVDLKKADRIVSVGMGFNREEDLGLARDLAGAMGAEVGCSRSIAEERRWMPESRYVGITGVQVKPLVYLAVGISGQAQHVYGIKDSRIIVAVNNSESAPIFRAADYGIVADLYDVLPLLTETLKNL